MFCVLESLSSLGFDPPRKIFVILSAECSMSFFIFLDQVDNKEPSNNVGMATIRPNSVVTSAIDMPSDNNFGSPVPNSVIMSKVSIIPVTVPSSPSNGAIEAITRMAEVQILVKSLHKRYLPYDPDRLSNGAMCTIEPG